MTYVPSMNEPFHSWCAKNSYSSNYIPANIPGQQNMNMNRNEYKEYSLSWWMDDCFYKYPYILVSAAYGLEIPNFREHYKIPIDVFHLADSGGYQVATQDLDIDAVDVIRWQENNADAGLILDVPPFTKQESFQLGKPQDFEKSMLKTKSNGERMYNAMKREDFTLYGVVQGETWDKLTQWFNALTTEITYDAYSVKPHPSTDVFKVAQAGIFALEHFDNKPFHMLMVSGVNTMVIASYISRYYDGKITYDSSSYARGSIGREYITPFDLSSSLMFGNKKNNQKLSTLPCVCPVCSNIDIKDLWIEGSLPGALISLHNLYWYIMYSQTINSLIEQKDAFMKFVKKFCKDSTLQAIEMIDYYMETKDPERVINRYKPYMTSYTDYTQTKFRI